MPLLASPVQPVSPLDAEALELLFFDELPSEHRQAARYATGQTLASVRLRHVTAMCELWMTHHCRRNAL
jgi:hypothetical protein